MQIIALRVLWRHFYTSTRTVAEHRFLRVVITFFALAGLVLLLTPPNWYPSWMASQLTGVGALIFAFLIILPTMLFTISTQDGSKTQRLKQESRTRLQVSLAIIFLLAFSGSCGLFELYRFGIPYDKILHFFNSMLATLAGGLFIYHWNKISPLRAIILAAILVMIINIGWEVLEFTSDTSLGTNSFGIDGKDVAIDTIGDLAMDVVGGIAGLVAARFNKKLGI